MVWQPKRTNPESCISTTSSHVNTALSGRPTSGHFDSNRSRWFSMVASGSRLAISMARLSHSGVAKPGRFSVGSVLRSHSTLSEVVASSEVCRRSGVDDRRCNNFESRPGQNNFSAPIKPVDKKMVAGTPWFLRTGNA